MNILIDDGMQVEVGTGIGKYTQYLYSHIKKRKDCEVDLYRYKKKGKATVSDRLSYLLHINSKSYRSICSSYDVIHYTNYALPFFRSRKCKYVVTIHDLASYLHAETLPFLYRFYSRFVVWYAMRDADSIVTVSDSVKREIEERFSKYSYKVDRVYPGYYSEFSDIALPERYFSNSLLSIDKKKFFLFVGTVEKRKNVDIIISAFFKLKEQFSEAHDYKLVLAGREGYGYNEFTKRISESNFSTDVVFTGYISRGDCAKLYMETSAYIFPTIYEGFGSTQLECMAFNTPLILSDIPTNREVSQDYGIYFDLADIESLVSKMKTIVIGDFDENLLRLTAKRYLNRFTWDKSADEMISVYSNVVRENNE